MQRDDVKIHRIDIIKYTLHLEWIKSNHKSNNDCHSATHNTQSNLPCHLHHSLLRESSIFNPLNTYGLTRSHFDDDDDELEEDEAFHQSLELLDDEEDEDEDDDDEDEDDDDHFDRLPVPHPYLIGNHGLFCHNFIVGTTVGSNVGSTVGAFVGAAVGDSVGFVQISFSIPSITSKNSFRTILSTQNTCSSTGSSTKQLYSTHSTLCALINNTSTPRSSNPATA